jgi:hypothetical protein
MKLRLLLPSLLALALATALGAQSTQSVPLSNPAQPATVNVSLFRGSITVRAGAAGVVTVATKPGPDQKGPLPSPPPAAPPGMRLLNAGGAVAATQANNVVTIHSSVMSGDTDTTLTVPASSTLDLHTMRGDITVTGVTGDISVQAMDGKIALEQVGGSIVAHALRGDITATISQLGTKPSSFSSLNGDINLTLPADARANLRLQDDRGGIYLDNAFDFKQTANTVAHTAKFPPLPPPLPAPKGPGNNVAALTAQMDMLKAMATANCSGAACGPSVTGTLNGGGVDLLVQDFRGNIYLHRGR